MATLLTDGRWQARYRPKIGKPLVWYAQTEDEAENEKAKYLNALKNPPPSIRSTSETTVQEYAKVAWWPGVEASGSDGTQDRYRRLWRKHVKPRFGHLALRDVHYEDVQGWVTEMVNEGVSPNEIASRRSILSMVLNLAVRNRLIDRNPAGDVKLPKADERIRVMSVSKAMEVFRAVEGTNMAAPVFCALVLGMRRGEAMGLRWENVDMATRRINVMEQRRRIRTGAYKLGQTPPKRKKRRSYILPELLFQQLLKVGNLESDWVCTGAGRRPANPEHVTERWGVIAERLGLEEWTYHDLRHGAAGLLAYFGVDLLTIAAILGHKKIDTTQLYAAAQEASATRGFETLSSALHASTMKVDALVTTGIN